MHRRSLLRAGICVGVSGLAGCVLGRGRSPGGSTPGPDLPNDPFAGVTFDGPDLVVRLVEDHSVAELNLITPDGSLFTQSTVEEGVTTVRLPILEIQPVNWVHYTPGVNRLVAVSGADTYSMDLELRPELRIVDVRQYRAGEGADFGLLEVEIENVGTGPTWVYQITYEGAPNWAANDEFVSDPGSPSMIIPDMRTNCIVTPGQSQTFVDGNPPLLFSEEFPTCDIEPVEFFVKAGQPIMNSIISNITAKISGEPLSAGLANEYACSDVQITNIKSS